MSDFIPREGEWMRPPAPWFFMAARPDRVLVVMYFPTAANVEVMALEIGGKGTLARAAAITQQTAFEDHAHKAIGTRKTEAGARRLAERFARRWKAGDVEIKDCDCGGVTHVR